MSYLREVTDATHEVGYKTYKNKEMSMILQSEIVPVGGQHNALRSGYPSKSEVRPLMVRMYS